MLACCHLESVRRRFEVTTCQHSPDRSEEHTSELQSKSNLVCRLLLAKKHRWCSRTRISSAPRFRGSCLRIPMMTTGDACAGSHTRLFRCLLRVVCPTYTIH